MAQERACASYAVLEVMCEVVERMSAQDEYATVDEVIEILKELSDKGHGEYIVVCNNEYYFAEKNEEPNISEDSREVSLGGYCDQG